MPITSSLSSDGSELAIMVAGRFDFSSQQQFRQAYESIAVKPARYRIDMSAANYLDKSALGMLLLLRDHASGNAADVHIANCSAEIRTTLQRSNFERLFNIT
ncbi:MAG: anti-sigma-factor antagonist [Verrucomicrobiaceae bacterium]|nr:anti-sigma-factor antagonist [Verrucomicrobiaceae bacterium]